MDLTDQCGNFLNHNNFRKVSTSYRKSIRGGPCYQSRVIGRLEINKQILLQRSLVSNTSANTSAEAEAKEVCQGRTPCGWAVYNRITRYIDYFMKNKYDFLPLVKKILLFFVVRCECSKEKKCLRDDDDISITAYVYRCKIDDGSKNTS